MSWQLCFSHRNVFLVRVKTKNKVKFQSIEICTADYKLWNLQLYDESDKFWFHSFVYDFLPLIFFLLFTNSIKFPLKVLLLLFFRAPRDVELRKQWNDRISKHQKIMHDKTSFSICGRHFTSSDFITKGDKRVLRSDAVPSIFDEKPKKQTLKINKNSTSDSRNHFRSSLQSKRYCKINCCENEGGTTSKEIAFFW